jgi:hypothetical protein
VREGFVVFGAGVATIPTDTARAAGSGIATRAAVSAGSCL